MESQPQLLSNDRVTAIDISGTAVWRAALATTHYLTVFLHEPAQVIEIVLRI